MGSVRRTASLLSLRGLVCLHRVFAGISVPATLGVRHPRLFRALGAGLNLNSLLNLRTLFSGDQTASPKRQWPALPAAGTMAQVSNMTAAERATVGAAGAPVGPTHAAAPMQTTSVTTEERRAVRGGFQAVGSVPGGRMRDGACTAAARGPGYPQPRQLRCDRLLAIHISCPWVLTWLLQREPGICLSKTCPGASTRPARASWHQSPAQTCASSGLYLADPSARPPADSHAVPLHHHGGRQGLRAQPQDRQAQK